LSSTKDLILETVSRLREQDYRFTVTAQGPPWDVYRFTRFGKIGTTALRIVEGRLEIGVFAGGELNEEQVLEKLLMDGPN